MFKRLLIVLMLIVSATVATGCQPEPEEFDESALKAVNSYVEEMTEALRNETLEADLKGWVRDYYEEEELPFTYDEERRQWLIEHRENLKALRDRHLQGSFPAEEEIASWQVVVVRGESEWLLEGPEALDTLDKLEDLYAETVAVIDMIVESGGELDIPQSQRVLDLIEQLEPQAKEIKDFFYR